MQAANKPVHEKERLQTLRDYKVLDTLPELGFDEIVQLASMICNLPIALVSLIDDERQWFKAKIGVDATETPRDVSFCGHAIHGAELFEVQDSTKDDRFFDNPLVTGGPKVIFYAGQPLIAPNGHAIGTLCVIDNKPNALDRWQKQSLQLLANQVVAQLELRKQQDELLSANKEIKDLALAVDEERARSFEASRLASLGQMAGGIAHEINNPLSVIQLASLQIRGIAQKSEDDSSAYLKACDQIDSTVLKISKTVHSMKNISRRSVEDHLVSVSASQTIQDAFNIVEANTKKQGIQLSLDGDKDAKILCIASEVSQVLINLIGNAIDEISQQKNPWVRVEVKSFDDYTSICVIDSGKGIPDDTVKKIMDPFFTTKPPGQGTGLGLSISHSLMERQRGSLKYKLKDGHTCFELIFQKVEQQKSTA